MQHVNALSRIFEEDLRLLENGVFESKKHKLALRKDASKLHTYCKIELRFHKGNTFTPLGFKEIPFLTLEDYAIDSSCSKDKDAYFLYPKLFDFIKEFTEDKYTIEQLSYELEDTLITVHVFLSIDYNQLSKQDVCYYYYYKLMDTIHKEFSKDFIDTYYGSNDVKELPILIAKYQQQIELYLNSLLFVKPPSIKEKEIKMGKTIAHIYKRIEFGLLKLLKYMKWNCPQYFDRYAIMPAQLRNDFYSKYRKDAESLQELIQKQHLSTQLKTELCRPLQDIINAIYSKGCTYHHKAYYRTYIYQLRKLFSSMDMVSFDELYGVLIAVDFNTQEIAKMLIDIFLVRLENYTDHYEQQLYLQREMTRIEHIQIVTEIRYKMEFPSLKTYVLSYMEQCLDNTLNAMDSEVLYPEILGATDRSGLEIEPLPKRELNLSISEISLFTRLLMDTDIISIPDGDKRKFFQFLAQVFTSKGASEISEGSIRNGYYSISDATFSGVEKKLLQMLRMLKMHRTAKSA